MDDFYLGNDKNHPFKQKSHVDTVTHKSNKFYGEGSSERFLALLKPLSESATSLLPQRSPDLRIDLVTTKKGENSVEYMVLRETLLALLLTCVNSYMEHQRSKGQSSLSLKIDTFQLTDIRTANQITQTR